MSEIIFKNGSTIKAEESTNTVRGKRAAIDPFYYAQYEIFDKEELDKVIREFLNKERINRSNEVDSDIYLSSRKEDELDEK